MALVTGAGRGIGRAIALALAGQGASLVLTARTAAQIEETAREIEAQGGRAVAQPADVSSAAQVDQVVGRALREMGKIDILVNNAGITRDSVLLRMKEEDWDAVLGVNLKSAFLCTRAAAKSMLRNRYGRIINITSVVGLMGNAGQANYAASKAGLIGFTRSVARELASRNITCNAVAPGYIQTEMTRELPENTRQWITERIPMGYMGDPEDVARVVCFLASPQTRYVTGQVFNVDGGMVM
ncbi:MAG TPA: 3-oxoacyl-[acyl-carrier-protein] reductase [Candidatus Nitrosotenuis sp.]|nr:3-oxoacyl-[acyl-carrier-protein] reductase [Candidatus Nitrosotenuis sp.]